VGRRKVILAGGVLLWSVRTALSGRAWDFASLFVFRLAVGVGKGIGDGKQRLQVPALEVADGVVAA